MRPLRYFPLAAIAGLCFAIAAPGAHAQVSIGVQIGQPPECPYGYFDYPPYDCAPFGYYGPQWFPDGVFIGAGPWYQGPDDFDGWVNRRYDPRYGYRGPLPRRGEHSDWDHHRGWERNFHGDYQRHEMRRENGNGYGQDQDRRDNSDGYGQRRDRRDNGGYYGQNQNRRDDENGNARQRDRRDNGGYYGQDQNRREDNGNAQQRNRHDDDNRNGQYQNRDNRSNGGDNGGYRNGHDTGHHHDDDDRH